MRHLIRATPKISILVEAPPMLAALVVAELFYKFGSLTLELLAFVCTWYVFSLILGAATRKSGFAPHVD